MVYLDKGVRQDRLTILSQAISDFSEVTSVTFVSKEDALAQLKADMVSRSAFIDNLQSNPLPHSLVIRMKRSQREWSEIEAFAGKIREMKDVESVEYGQKWLGRFLNVFNLFRITGYAMIGLFFMIALFITANTVRLALYSRRQEVEIMRLVGATDRFIITPFYIEGLMQGVLGGILGLGLLLVAYIAISSGIDRNPTLAMFFDIHFLSVGYSCLIVLCSAFLGWLGCYLSLKQFLKI